MVRINIILKSYVQLANATFKYPYVMLENQSRKSRLISLTSLVRCEISKSQFPLNISI